MKKEYILLGILVVILLAAGLWIFQIISEYQRADQEYEELKEYVKEAEEEEQDQEEGQPEKQEEEESGEAGRRPVSGSRDGAMTSRGLQKSGRRCARIWTVDAAIHRL